jgi:hypothetical protein
MRQPSPLLRCLAFALAYAIESSAEESGAASAEPAPTVAATPAPTAYDRGVEAFARGRFQDARDRFDEALRSPQSPEDGARTRALRDLADGYLRAGASLVFANVGTATPPRLSELPDERTDDEIVQYYLSSVPYGIALGAYASALANATSPAAVVFPVLGGVALTAGAMAYADHRHTRPFGEPQAIVSGGLVGLQLAIPLAVLAGSNSSTENLALFLGSVTTAGAAGYFANRAWGTTPGEMSFVGSTALWGNVLGLLGSSAAGAHGDDLAIVSIASVATGTALGAVFARDLAPSIAHVRYIDFGALAGGIALGGAYLGLSGSSGNGKAGATITGLGVLGGGALAAYMTRDMKRDEPRRATAFQWAPTFAPTDGGVTIGVGGTF